MIDATYKSYMVIQRSSERLPLLLEVLETAHKRWIVTMNLECVQTISHEDLHRKMAVRHC